MMMRTLLLASLLMVACGETPPVGGGDPDLGDGTATFTVRFAGKVGADDFSCASTFAGLGTTQTVFTPRDFRLYLHDLTLVRAPGDEVPLELEQDGRWQVQSVALLDFEDKRGTCTGGTTDVNTTIVGRAPAGTYQGIHFKVGVPFELNHQDLANAASPLNLSTMFWAWNGGYKFVRIEGKSTGQSFLQLHLGSTGCKTGNAVTSCSRPNRPDVLLTGFDPASGTIAVDLAALFAETDLDSNESGTPPGCMADSADGDCDGMFKSLGLDLTAGTPLPSQTLFRVL
jgi:uncharacterized repeat protein (TIGR04052 family)